MSRAKFHQELLKDTTTAKQAFDDELRGYSEEQDQFGLFQVLLGNGINPSSDALANATPVALDVYRKVKQGLSSPATNSTANSTLTGSSNGNNKRPSEGIEDLKTKTVDGSHGLWVIENMEQGGVKKALWKMLRENEEKTVEEAFNHPKETSTYIHTIENLRDMVKELITHTDDLHLQLTGEEKKMPALKKKHAEFYKAIGL